MATFNKYPLEGINEIEKAGNITALIIEMIGFAFLIIIGTLLTRYLMET